MICCSLTLANMLEYSHDTVILLVRFNSVRMQAITNKTKQSEAKRSKAKQSEATRTKRNETK